MNTTLKTVLLAVALLIVGAALYWNFRHAGPTPLPVRAVYIKGMAHLQNDLMLPLSVTAQHLPADHSAITSTQVGLPRSLTTVPLALGLWREGDTLQVQAEGHKSAAFILKNGEFEAVQP